MKIIYPENISSLSANNEDVNFPAENLEDEHPKKVWKGTEQTAVIEVVSNNSSGMAIFKTNSETMIIEVRYGQTIAWDTDMAWDTDISWDDSGVAPPPVTYQLSGEDEGAGWADWSKITVNHTIIISLDAGSGNIIEAGIVSVGIVKNFNDPLVGFNEKLIDYSVIKELNNGAFFIKKRDIVREFSGSFDIKRDDEFYVFMMDILKKKGQKPMPVRMSSNLTTWHWIVYGRVTSASGTHDLPEYSTIQFILLEVL